MLESPFESRKFKLWSRVLAVPHPKLVGLDSADLSLATTEVYQVIVPFVLPPQITSNQTLSPEETIPWDEELGPATSEDLTAWLFDQTKITTPECLRLDLLGSIELEDRITWFGPELQVSETENIELLGTSPTRAGKYYRKQLQVEKQLDLIGGSERCRHGLTKKWCEDCRKEEKKAQRATLQIDIFDLILPTLQPPLGEQFDNPIAFPPGKRLYQFQCDGIKFLIEHPRALLGDEMGLGKSIQTITAVRLLIRLGKIKNGLLLCPKAVVTDWETKFREWAPELRVQNVNGSQIEREALWDTPAHIYLTTYEKFREDLRANQAKLTVDLCILDEIQRIKNPSAKLSQSVRYVEANWRWGLSGTPLENKIEDVISIFSFIKPGLFPRDQVPGEQSVRERIKPYFLRRRKTEALPELQPKVRDEVWLDLLDSQRKAYERAERDGIVELSDQGDSVTVQHVFALITKLKQICNIDPVTHESCKLDYLLEQLPEIVAQGDKALVFSQFPEKTLKAIAPKLSGFAPLSYDGSLSDRQRSAMVQSFQESETNKIMLMSVKSGGVGITLTRASYVYHYDLWWNPSIAAQAEDRVHRIGQNKTVFVTSLYTTDTIEQRIKALLDQKRGLFNLVIDELSDTDLAKQLTEDEIFGLFNLGKPKRTDSRQNTPAISNRPLSLENLSARDFETLVGRLYEKMGYAVRVTPPSRDGGVDVFALRYTDSGTEQLAIQCKHYPGHKVSVDAVRSLYGVVQASQHISRGVLVTSGGFSSESDAFATGKRIELISASRLLGLMEKYGVSATP